MQLSLKSDMFFIATTSVHFKRTNDQTNCLMSILVNFGMRHLPHFPVCSYGTGDFSISLPCLISFYELDQKLIGTCKLIRAILPILQTPL